MAYSTQRAVSDGTLTYLDIAIGYQSRNDIKVFMNDLPAPPGSWAWAGVSDKRINFTQAVPAGVEVLLQRSTRLDRIINVFAKGAKFTNVTMDMNFEQVLLLTQEAVEGSALSDIYNDVDFHNYKIKNLGLAVADNDAITFGQVKSLGTGAYQAQLAAEAARDNARQWATQLTTPVTGSDFSAKQYALNSDFSASSASFSASNALARATAAATSASASQTSRLASEAARDRSELARDRAEGAAAPATGIFTRLDAAEAAANTANTNASTAVTTANGAATTANAAMPKAGGTFTGTVNFAGVGGLTPAKVGLSEITNNRQVMNLRGAAGNTIYIGYNNGIAELQVENTYFGSTWPMNISGNAAYASNAGNASGVNGITGWRYDSVGINPAYIWATNGGANDQFLVPPANLSVSYANSCGTANAIDGWTRVVGNLTGSNVLSLRWDGQLVCRVDGTDVIVYPAVSDARVKKDIKPTVQDSLALLKRIEFVQYRFDHEKHPIGDNLLHKVGVTTQQLESIEPNWVSSGIAIQQVNQVEILYMLMHAVQQLAKEVEELKRR